MTKDIRSTPRLFVESGLAAGHTVNVSADQAHYLRHVMRMKEGAVLRLFNGRDGEWMGHFGAVSKRSVAIMPEKQLCPQKAVPDLWLCAAPIKKAHFDYMIEKATEIGVAAVQPVLTERTQIREVNVERCRSITIEAAEQSERLDIPDIRSPVTLPELIAYWPEDRVLTVCAEWGETLSVYEALLANADSSPHLKRKAALLTGPEGGFVAAELEALRKMPGAVFIRLGPRILRADTAAIAALSLWQAICGDWGT